MKFYKERLTVVAFRNTIFFACSWHSAWVSSRNSEHKPVTCDQSLNCAFTDWEPRFNIFHFLCTDEKVSKMNSS